MNHVTNVNIIDSHACIIVGQALNGTDRFPLVTVSQCMQLEHLLCILHVIHILVHIWCRLTI